MKFFKSIPNTVINAAAFITAVGVVAGVGIKVDDWVEARESGTVQFESPLWCGSGRWPWPTATDSEDKKSCKEEQ